MRIGLHSVCTVSNCSLSSYLNVGRLQEVPEFFVINNVGTLCFSGQCNSCYSIASLCLPAQGNSRHAAV